MLLKTDCLQYFASWRFGPGLDFQPSEWGTIACWGRSINYSCRQQCPKLDACLSLVVSQGVLLGERYACDITLSVCVPSMARPLLIDRLRCPCLFWTWSWFDTMHCQLTMVWRNPCLYSDKMDINPSWLVTCPFSSSVHWAQMSSPHPVARGPTD